MATINGSVHTGPTQDQLLSAIVDKELEKRVVLLSTCTDVSALATPGYDQIKLPKDDLTFSGPAAQNIDGDTPVAFQTGSLTTENLDLDQHVNLPYSISDRAQLQNKVALKSHFAEQAGRKMAQYQDDTIATQLATLTTDAFIMSGPADEAVGTAASVSISDISQARLILDKRNIPSNDRFLIVSPAQEKAMLNITNFIDASKYGAREALLNGEIGKVYDIRVIKSNALADGEAYVVQKEWMRYAVQSGVQFEEQRGAVNVKRDEMSFDMLWGFKVKHDGVYGVKMTDI